MGQYQEKNLNKKGAMLELAHRNSQASVPFMVSSRGYGIFLEQPGQSEQQFLVQTRQSGTQRAQKNWTTLLRQEIHRLKSRNSILRQPEGLR